MSKKIEWLKRGMTANNGLQMQEVCDQINNSLHKSEIAPENTQLVAVDNTNTQTMLNIGDGLSVENGSLKASGGSGEKKYTHIITMGGSTYKNYISLKLTSTSNEIFTANKLVEYLYNIGCNSINITSLAFHENQMSSS